MNQISEYDSLCCADPGIPSVIISREVNLSLWQAEGVLNETVKNVVRL